MGYEGKSWRVLCMIVLQSNISKTSVNYNINPLIIEEDKLVYHCCSFQLQHLLILFSLNQHNSPAFWIMLRYKQSILSFPIISDCRKFTSILNSENTIITLTSVVY